MRGRKFWIENNAPTTNLECFTNVLAVQQGSRAETQCWCSSDHQQHLSLLTKKKTLNDFHTMIVSQKSGKQVNKLKFDQKNTNHTSGF